MQETDGAGTTAVRTAGKAARENRSFRHLCRRGLYERKGRPAHLRRAQRGQDLCLRLGFLMVHPPVPSPACARRGSYRAQGCLTGIKEGLRCRCTQNFRQPRFVAIDKLPFAGHPAERLSIALRYASEMGSHQKKGRVEGGC